MMVAWHEVPGKRADVDHSDGAALVVCDVGVPRLSRRGAEDALPKGCHEKLLCAGGALLQPSRKLHLRMNTHRANVNKHGSL